jgi:hypothetical protein
MQLQQLINEAYSLLLAAPYIEQKENLAPDLVIEGINALFLGRESSAWSQAEGEAPQTEEEKLYRLGEYFPEIEGQQEQVYEAMTMVDAVLEETREAQKDVIEKKGLSQSFEKLGKLMKLSSGSAFVELEQQGQEEKLTKAQVQKAADELVDELGKAFQGQSRMIRRAVMANTLEKMPVFFSTPQEVADYVSQSLNLCDDEAEKYASKQLIRELMG